MQHDLSSSAGNHDSDDPEEVVLVEAHRFSDDEGEEIFAQDEEEDRLDFVYKEEGREEGGEGDFEDDEDEMGLTRFRLHDLNTLRHLYRFGILNTYNSRSSLKFTS